jgi:hypothetical protein
VARYLQYVQWVTLPVAAVLNVLLVHALLKRGGQQYVLVTVWAVLTLLTTVVESAGVVGADMTWINTAYYYWIPEAVNQFVSFAIIIILCVRRLEQRTARARFGRWLVIGSLVFVIASAALLYDSHPNRWLTALSRNLNFGALLLNVVLWGSLIPDPNRDFTMLKVSGALGVNLAGQAAGQGLRQLWQISRAFAYAGNLVLVLTHLLCLYLLWKDFAVSEVRAPSSHTVTLT